MYAKSRVPMYEGDGFIHSMQDRLPASRTNATAVSEHREIEPRARQLRSEALARLLRRLAAWLEKKIMRVRMSALENYLSRSSDLADVERRLRQAERDGRFFPG